MDAFLKDPDAVLDYKIDWSAWLGDDTISQSAWSAEDGITIDSDENDDNRDGGVAVRRSGGHQLHRDQPHHHGGRARGRPIAAHQGRGAIARCLPVERSSSF